MKFYIRTPIKSSPTRPNNPPCNPQTPMQKKDFNPHQKLKPKPECKPPHKNKKIDFKCIKKDTINSLNEVEHFLCNFQNICKYLKLYKILH